MAFFIVRQRALSELRSDNESLRQQMETQSNGVRSGAVIEVPSTNSAAALSVEEKTELLRLRGQVPSLRSDAAEASNRVAGLAPTRTPTAASARNVSPEEQKNRNVIGEFVRGEPYRSANKLARSVQVYLLQHAGKIPEDLATVPAAEDNSFTDETVKRFELVRTGSVAGNPDMAPYLLIAHEKEPIQLPDGKWVRLYIQANGGLTIAGPLPNKPPLDDSDFIRHMEEFGKQKVQPK
jgi:hypothetical protein